MRVQGAATGLLLGDTHRMAVALKQAHGRALGVSERLAHDAAREDTHVGAVAVDPAEWRALRACRKGRRPPDATRQCPRGETREPQARTDVGEARHQSEATRPRDRVESGARPRRLALPVPGDPPCPPPATREGPT